METVNEIKTETPLTILFVDDEANILQSLRRLFVDEDYNVLIAHGGDEALKILSKHTDIGLIVSDQRMPGLSGVDFLEKAKETVPDALRILLTGYADIDAVADAINRGGAYRYITKPWKDDDLIQVIGDAAQQFSLRKENRRLQKIVEKQNDELKRWNAQLEYFVQEQTLEIQNKNKELENLNSNLKQNFKSSLLAFSSLIELRDRRTSSHSKNVADLSVKIAQEIGLSSNEIETVSAAALLHDIGKIGMSDLTLNQKIEDMGAQGEKEYRNHPVRGQAAVDSVEYLREAGTLIRHHHERVDGGGFPDKFFGDKIPLGARIIGAADYFDRTFSSIPDDNPMEATLKKVGKEFGNRLDARLHKYLDKAARDVYAAFKVHKSDHVELELQPAKLQEGMVLSRDFKSGTGLTLLAKGIALTAKTIQSIKRYYELDPSTTGVFVLMKRQT